MKLILTIAAGSLQGRRFELTEGFLTIGRSENSSVRFDALNEKIASKQHAFIEAKPDGFKITDNKSTNGTLVNEQKIETVRLNHGDQIQFGTNGIKAVIEIVNEVEALPSTVQLSASGAVIGQNQFPALQMDAAPRASAEFRNSIATLGMGNMEVIEPQKSQTGKYVVVGLTILGVVFLSLIVVGLMLAQLGPVAALVAAVIAFLPAAFYVLPLIWLDRYDPEPLWLLALAFSWGALVAIIISFVVNTAIGVGVALTFDPETGELAGAVISAPIFEEGTKGLGLVIILVFFRKYFDGILDGIIFGGVIALGFATVENVLYYGNALNSGIPALIVVLFFVRGVLSPFAHVFFTSMTGIGCGISRESHNGAVKIIMPVVGYIFAVILHAIWNGVPTLISYLFEIEGIIAFFAMYGLFQVPFFGIFAIFAGYIMYRQNRTLKEMLAIDVAQGVIPQDHYVKATSAFRSSFWLLGSVFSGKFRARSRYLRAIGKLGLSYWHIQRAKAAQGETASFQQNPILRQEVVRWRDQV